MQRPVGNPTAALLSPCVREAAAGIRGQSVRQFGSGTASIVMASMIMAGQSVSQAVLLNQSLAADRELPAPA